MGPIGEAWVHASGRRGTTLELVTAARRVAARVGVFGVAEELAGSGPVLGRYGVSRICAVDGIGDRLAGAPLAAAMAPIVAGAGLVLFSTSYEARDVAGRHSARLDRPVQANGLAVVVEGQSPAVETSIFGGTLAVRTAFRGPPPWLVSLRPKSCPAEEAGEAVEPSVQVVAAPPDVPSPQVVARHTEEREGPALEEAAVVVAGGRGLGSAEAFAQIQELARLLGGAPGATRAVVDAGWAPYAWQVGQTGTTVAPSVYLAFGISGAVQHVIGMKGAKHVVAVNKDREAPVFSLADLGVVGDARQVLPRLIAEVRARRARGEASPGDR